MILMAFFMDKNKVQLKKGKLFWFICDFFCEFYFYNIPSFAAFALILGRERTVTVELIFYSMYIWYVQYCLCKLLSNGINLSVY